MARFLAVLIFSLFALGYGFQIQPRIISGDLADPIEFPFYVHIDHFYASCGGSILSNRWIITAAHCLRRKVEVYVHFGLDLKGNFKHKIEVPTSKQFMYPKYNATTERNDIGLLELPTPIEFNQFIRPVQLPNVCDSPHSGGEEVIAAGVGAVQIRKRNPDFRLRQASFFTMHSGYCSTQAIYKLDSDSIICAYGNEHNGQTISLGDSGGPLLWAHSGDLVGVTSLGIGYAGADDGRIRVQVFTNVPYYYRWIEHITGLELPKCDGPQAPTYPEIQLEEYFDLTYY